MILRLDHVLITAPRGAENTARDFYGGLLGLPELPKPEDLRGRGGVWFQIGDHQLHIGVEDAPNNAGSRRHLALVVDNLDDMRARLSQAGFETKADVNLPGYRRFHTRDPFENRLELMEAV